MAGGRDEELLESQAGFVKADALVEEMRIAPVKTAADAKIVNTLAAIPLLSVLQKRASNSLATKTLPDTQRQNPANRRRALINGHDRQPDERRSVPAYIGDERAVCAGRHCPNAPPDIRLFARISQFTEQQ